MYLIVLVVELWWCDGFVDLLFKHLHKVVRFVVAERYLNRDEENMLAHSRREIRIIQNAHSILLGGNYELAVAWHTFEHIEDIPEIVTGKIVMVVEVYQFNLCRESSQISHKRPWIGYSGQAEHQIGGLQPRQRSELGAVDGEHRFRVAIHYSGIEQFLGGNKLQILLHHSHVHRLNVRRAFGNHHHIGTHQATQRLTEKSQRKHLVGKRRPVIVHKGNVHLWLHISVLECVIQKNEIYVGINLEQFFNALCAALTHRKRYQITEFMENLEWLVAYVLGRKRTCGKDKPMGNALVSAAQHSYVVAPAQVLHYILHMWGLAGTTSRDVSNRNNRNFELLLLEQSHVETRIAQPHHRSVDPRKWREDCIPQGLALLLVQYVEEIKAQLFLSVDL